MTNEELEQEVKRLEEQITNLRIKILESKAEKKPYEVEVPEDIEDYYYVDELGRIYLVRGLLDFDEHEYELLYKRGLAFKTKEEAEKFDKERILINKLKDWAKKYNGGWTPDWEGDEKGSYNIRHVNQSKMLESFYSYYYLDFTKLPYFKSEEIAEQFIKEFGEEIKEVFC